MDFKKNLKLLPRKRIFDLMEQIPSHPLSMIIAPMGYGKTASLRSYIERTELESLWMTMPRATNLSETELFWFLLVRAVTRRDAAFAQRLSRMGFPQNSIDVFRIIDMLHDLPPERPLLVVIDDLHFIESAAVYEFIYQVGCSGIPWLRIVILSRTYPNFPTAEMELKGTLFVIGPQELAFTAEEADEYYALVQFDPPAEVRRHIFRISQGWIASILLLVEGYQNTGRLDDNASINDMFVSSVFRYYSEYEKRLLTQVAVLDTFTQKMLNYVLDDPNASAAVESACKANAFIFRNQQGRYCFHQMFRDFLLSGQAAPLQDSSVFLHRAAQWYSDNGNLKEAIRYWMIANDRDRIMETLEIIPPMEVLTLNLDTMNSFFIEGDEEQRFRYEARKLCKPGAPVCMFIDWRQLPAATDALQWAGWIWRGTAVWDKGNSRPQKGRFRQQAEYIVWGSNGDMPLSRPVPCLPGVFKYGNPQNRIHLTEKPLQLMRDVVKIVEPGGHILDPFAGSGTTVLAAVLEGYTATGIEVTDEYARRARERIAKEVGVYEDLSGVAS